jgi:hypothetical protein
VHPLFLRIISPLFHLLSIASKKFGIKFKVHVFDVVEEEVFGFGFVLEGAKRR